MRIHYIVVIVLLVVVCVVGSVQAGIYTAPLVKDQTGWWFDYTANFGQGLENISEVSLSFDGSVSVGTKHSMQYVYVPPSYEGGAWHYEWRDVQTSVYAKGLNISFDGVAAGTYTNSGTISGDTTFTFGLLNGWSELADGTARITIAPKVNPDENEPEFLPRVTLDSATLTVTTVPEPTSMLALIGGVSALAAIKRRR